MRRHSRLLIAGSIAVLLVAFQTRVRVAEPAQPSLLKDINTLVSGSSSSPNQFTIIGGTAFFTALDGPHGKELWATDGTPAGTRLVKDIFPSSGSSSPTSLINVNDVLFFTATDGVSGAELWRSDGSEAGTVLVKDINPGPANSTPQFLTNVNGVVFFQANDGVSGVELWRSDGSDAGTVLVKDINPGSVNSSPQFFTAVNNTVFFQATDGATGAELWRSDGSEAGTVLVKDINPGPAKSTPQFLTNVNGTVYFQANDGVSGVELWRTDGTAAGTSLVKDIWPGSGDSSPLELIDLNGTLLFAASDPVNGSALWRSNGTPAGTVLLGASTPSKLTTVNGILFFEARDGSGLALWRSDGSATGTVMVKDISPGSALSDPGPFTNVNGTVFFAAADPVNGRELWRSNGTEAGTVLVKDISPAGVNSNPGNLTNLNGLLLFAANDAASGSELWRSDGTAAGTVLIADINTATGNSIVSAFTDVNGIAYFAANDGVAGNELWRSDGTAAGTALVQDIAPGVLSSNPSNLTAMNGTLFFRATDGVNGSELWRSDGTAAGTLLVKDILPGTGGSNPANLRPVNGTLFFAANDGVGVHGIELWRSDGTAAGTVLVKDINPGAGSSNPANLIDVNGMLFFTATDGVSGIELWRSDGTAAGTVLVKDINPGGSSLAASSANLIDVNGVLFFTANDGSHGAELWRSDGTNAGTVLVKDIWAGTTGSTPAALTNVEGALFFAASDGVTGTELWRSDGTGAGTVLVKDIFAGGPGSAPSLLTNMNGVLLFRANDGLNGVELWRSDGTSAGTILVKDIVPGIGSSAPLSLTHLNGTVFFSATDGTNGSELWQTDGTAAGTVLVKDIYPGAASSFPSASVLATVRGTLYFVANDGVTGSEPWTLKPFPDVAPLPNAVPIAHAGPDQILECADRNGTMILLDGSASSDANEDVLTYEWRDGANQIIGTTATLNVAVPTGAHLFTLTVNDGRGATSSDQVTVIVGDTTPPGFINIPRPITAPQTSVNGTAVTVPLPTASDVCDAAPTIASDAPALFPLGDTTVTFTARDASGNTATATTMVTIVKAGTITTVTSSVNPSVFGQAVTVTATVAVAAPGVGTPTGSVQFKDNGTSVGAPVALLDGAASVTTSLLTVGNHLFTADYIGDVNFDGSTGSVSQTVNTADTATTITSSMNPSAYGQGVTLTAAVTAGSVGVSQGTITFKDGPVLLAGPVPVDAAGKATFSTATLTVGGYTITAEYSGGSSFNPSIGSIAQVVNKADTTVTVASSLNPSSFGQSTTLTVTVVGGGAPVSNGSVTFKEGTTILSGPVAMNADGQATFSTSVLSAGTHTITAEYSGGSNFNGSTGSIVQVVNKADTTATVASAVNPSTFGQSATLTVTVGGAPASYGTVTFKEGTTVLAGSIPVNASGQASFSTSGLPAGTHTITAEYSGGSNFNGSTGSIVQVVNKADTTATVASSVNPSTFGQSATLTVTVGGAPASYGTVTFKEGTTVLAGSIPVNASGQASFSTSGLPAGTHTITAEYSGGSNFNGSTGSIVQVVNKADTTATVASSVNPSTFGQSATLTVTVGGAPASYGTVTFKEGTTVLAGSIPVNASGQASFSTSGLPAGTHTITAEYSGGSNFNGSTGSIVQVVNKADTTATVASSVNPSTFGQSATLTVTVGGAPASYGTVTFKEGTTVLAGSIPVNASGQASFSTSGLPAGTHTITAEYSGGSNFNGSTGSIVQVVNKADTTATVASAVNPSTFGQSATLTVTVGGAPASYGTVTFKEGTTVLAGSIPVNASGQASFSTSGLPAGTHTITAEYSGGSNFNGSTGSIAQVVNKATATVTLSDLTKTFTGSALSPTATTMPAGLAIIWTGAPQTNPGSYPVTATINDRNYQGSASGTLVINQVVTMATVTLSNLIQKYTGAPLMPTATTSPAGLAVTWTNAPQTATGLYRVSATIANPSYEGTATDWFAIFDPASYEQGSGAYTSPVGAYAVNPALSGTATITQLSARYNSTATLSSVTNTFKMTYADLSFTSSSMNYLVINGTRSYLNGEGTVKYNGVTEAAYFLLTVLDSSSVADKVRVKIWQKGGNGFVIYDTQRLGNGSAPDDAEPLVATSSPATVIFLKSK